MRRWTETTKWDDPWRYGLPPELKCAWDYICDNCDNAGVWEPNFSLAEARIFGGKKASIDWDAFRKSAGDRLEVLGERWWLRKFIAFQISSVLNPHGEKRKNFPHSKVIELLHRHGLTKKYAAVEMQVFGRTNLEDLPELPSPTQDDLPIADLKTRKKSAAEIILHLNKQADRNFAPVGENLRYAERALSLCGDDIAGIKAMVDRAVLQWTGTEYAEHLQPSTLFGSKKFRERYDKRNSPVVHKATKTPVKTDHKKGFCK